MHIYTVMMAVTLKEYGVKKPIVKELSLWVAENGDALKAVKKATKHLMKRNGWDSGVPLRARLLSVERRGTIDVL